MSVIEKFAAISETLTKLMSFIPDNEEAKKSFDEYFKSVSQDENFNHESAWFNFMLEGRVGEEKTPYTQFYLNANLETANEEKEIITAIGSAMTSFFEIKRILKNGFDLKNIINEQQNALPNGFLCLKGGELQQEIQPYKNKVVLYNLSDYFKEEYFQTKKVIYLPH